MKESLLTRYFPELSQDQLSKFGQLEGLYADWNSKINVISRKDISQLAERHVLHSLGISAAVKLRPNTLIMDLGTGGGFPGIPLAIMHPDISFHLVDSVGKKITVVNEVVKALDLKNVESFHCRAEDVDTEYDYVVTRAVMRLFPLQQLVRKKLKPRGLLIALKGGDLTLELAETRSSNKVYDLSDYFSEEFFETKRVVASNR